MLLGFIALYLLINVFIGWWAARRVKTTMDFVAAGRNLPTIVVATALFATWFGSETVMGSTAEFVEFGIQGIIEEPLGAAMCLILVGLFYARPLYKLNILTFNDYFRIRFGKTAEWISAVLMIPSYFGWIAAQFIALALVINVLTGLSPSLGILIVSVAVVFYTYLGGLWSVSITDFVQTLVIIVGMAIVAVSVAISLGDPGRVFTEVPEGFYRFAPEPGIVKVSEYITAWITIGLGSIASQDIFQRVFSARTEKASSNASVIAGLMYLSIAILPLFIALGAKILYPELLHGDKQLLIPFMVKAHSSLFVQIMFYGALISAIMSTASGAILAPATIVGENIVRPFAPNLNDAQLLQVMRLAVLGIAFISALMALSGDSITELVSQASTVSLVALFVPITAAIYHKKTSALGANLSMILGFLVWVPLEIKQTEIPASLYGLSASFLGLLIGNVISRLEKGQTRMSE